MPNTDAEFLERDDIQGLILRGYSNLRHARYYLLRIEDPALFKQWLGRQVSEYAISTAAKRHDEEIEAFNIAFTPSGLKKLGVETDTPFNGRDSFSLEFRDGMTDPERSRFLGDVGRNEPRKWIWGQRGQEDIDCLCLIFFRHADDADGTAETPVLELWERVHPPEEVASILRMWNAYLWKDGREPFGFKDGLSQPILRYTKRDYQSSNTDRAFHVVEPGEFVFGYPNQLGRFPLSPWVTADRDPQRRLRPLASGSWAARNGVSTLRDFGRNGTYLVLRQIEQHVDTFHRFLDAAAARYGLPRELLAARIVGRWRSGTPLSLSPTEDRQLPADNLNAFGYFDQDQQGYRCPLGAHIRRGNPRDVNAEVAGPDQALWTSNLHRILRRGRVYEEEDGKTGLMFLCLNTDLRRQFEFVQQHWMHNSRFGGLSDETDPLLGDSGRLTIQAPDGDESVDGLGGFVTVCGGAYFFMPGLAALACLADPR